MLSADELPLQDLITDASVVPQPIQLPLHRQHTTVQELQKPNRLNVDINGSLNRLNQECVVVLEEGLQPNVSPSILSPLDLFLLKLLVHSLKLFPLLLLKIWWEQL